MTDDLRIEPARASDAPRIAYLCRDEIELGLGWQWRSGTIARLMLRPDTEVVVARAGDHTDCEGFGALELGEDQAELILFGVATESRRTGVGRRLLSFLEDEAKDAGIHSVWLHVRRGNNAAVAFYESMGYRVQAHLLRYYRGQEDALRMRHVLTRADDGSSPGPYQDEEDLGALLRGHR